MIIPKKIWLSENNWFACHVIPKETVTRFIGQYHNTEALIAWLEGQRLPIIGGKLSLEEALANKGLAQYNAAIDTVIAHLKGGDDE